MAKSCLDCRELESDQEDGNDGQGEWYTSCNARSGVSNLRQFPFRKTNCAEHKERLK